MNIFTLCWELDKRIDNGHSLKTCQKLLEEYSTADYIYLLCKKVDYNIYGYKRIHIFGTIHIDVYIIIWKSYSISPLHGHPNNGCIMKILSNRLKEIKYRDLKIYSKSEMKERSIHYIEGNLIEHVVYNPTDTYSISLHVYDKN